MTVLYTRLLTYIFLATTLIGASICQAGITGTLSGKVSDKQALVILPGAQIIVEGTTIGAMTDKEGHYIIYNLPAGTYDVSVRMIGYAKLTIRDVVINADLATTLDLGLRTQVVPLEEIVITDQKRLIQKDVTSSTYFISGEDINSRLPIDRYLDAVETLPGVVGNHIRGGRQTDALHTLDGLPVQSVLSRQISSYFPNNSIAEMMVQTGGFSAEYGNATSGVINVISKDGRNSVRSNFKVYSDFIETGLSESDNTHRAEFDLSGPLTIGLGGPLIRSNYFISADWNISDTSDKDRFASSFKAPIFSNYNINGKLSFDIANNTILSLQTLVSNWRWRQLEPQWVLNPSGVAENKHYSHRFSASLTHTFNPKVFTTLRLARYSVKHLVLGKTESFPPELEFRDPTDANSQILSGSQPWDETTEEHTNIAKLDLVARIANYHLIKTGLELQGNSINARTTRVEPLSPKFGTPQLNSIVFNKVEDNFANTPTSLAFYFQNKLSLGEITADLGVRFDRFSPNVEFVESISDSAVGQQNRTVNSKRLQPASPRIGLSLPLSENERLHLNYGWFYNMPPLFYYYTNSFYAQNFNLLPSGNPFLEPTKTTSSEFSYKKLLGDDLLLVFSGFHKRYSNLIDTQTFLEGNTGSPDSPFSQYVSTGKATVFGYEFTFQKKINRTFSTRVSYTYMKAMGTSSSGEESYINSITDSSLIESGKFYPLSWDQRHSFILNADYEVGKLHLNLLYMLQSPLPITTEKSSSLNDQRMSWRNLVDLRIRFKKTRILGGSATPFIEIRNLLDQDNKANEITSTKGGSAYGLYDAINADSGRRLRVGLSVNL